MKTLLLTSVLWVTIAGPMVAARSPNPVRAVRRLFVFFVLYVALFIVYLSVVHASIVPQR